MYTMAACSQHPVFFSEFFFRKQKRHYPERDYEAMMAVTKHFSPQIEDGTHFV